MGAIKILRRPSRSTKALWALAIGATAISMLLRVRAPLWIRADNTLDDGLFGQLAGSLAKGDWLGPFDSRTLAKGPAYSMFIAASYVAHVPLLVAEQVLYLLAVAVLSVAMGYLAHSRWLATVAYVALALNPVHLGAAASSLGREVVYTSLSILLLGSVLLSIAMVPRLIRIRRGAGLAVLAIAGLFIGVVGAAYYICREERAWIGPALLLIGAAGIWSWRGRVAAVVWRKLAGLLVLLVVAAASFLASVHWVEQRNERAYGEPLITDLADGEMARAYALWQSVKAGPERRYIPVSVAARRAVYAVSPAAAQLEPYLDGPASENSYYKSHSCPGEACGDYLGAFFVWAFRGAVVRAGHYATEVDAQRYFRELADQISTACSRGNLKCGRQGLPMIPAIRLGDVMPILHSATRTTVYLLSFAAANPASSRGNGGSAVQWQLATAAIRGARNRDALIGEKPQTAAQQWPVASLDAIYRWLAYPAVLAALVGVLWELWSPRRADRAFALALSAILVALAARIAVIAVLDAVSYTAAQSSRYAIPANDLLVVFAMAGAWLLVGRVREAFAVGIAGDLLQRRARWRRGAGLAGSGGNAADGEDRLTKRWGDPFLDRMSRAGDKAIPRLDRRAVERGHAQHSYPEEPCD